MLPIAPIPTIRTAELLDRDAATRADAAAIAELQTASDTRILALVNGRPLIQSNAARTDARILWLSATELESQGWPIAGALRIYLGRDKTTGAPHFAVCVELPDPETPGIKPKPPAALVDLRTLALQGSMSAADMSLVGEALMLRNWHDGTHFCGRCGTSTRASEAGWKRICEPCQRDIFPRIDPVVIMLVTDGRRCVLTRESRFLPGMVSTLAGFIEPGEDIAHAVRRETLEEIGIKIGDVRFIASQPWPFPNSLMIGCIAEAVDFTLKPDPAEIETASWYDAAEVRAMLARRPSETVPWLPGKQSLANALIETWLAELGA